MTPQSVLKRLVDEVCRMIVSGIPGVVASKSIRLRGRPIVILHPGSSIELGDKVSIISKSAETVLGVHHPTILRTLSQGAKIVIGADTGMSGGVICASAGVRIGRRCLLGANVTIFDTDFHPVDVIPRRYKGVDFAISKEVVIGDDVFIGTGSIVMKGVTIGSGSVIGAGSVVSADIPADVVAAGNPCRVIRPLRLDSQL